MSRTFPRRRFGLLALAAPAAFGQPPERVRIAVFNVASAIPHYIAAERGLYAAAGLNVEAVMLQAAPLIVQAMIAGDVDAASNLVTLEGANINARRPNTALYFALNGQNAEFRSEMFLVRAQFAATDLRGLRGARILSAPGPANMAAARAVLAAQGLLETRDYTLTEQPMGVHVGALTAGTFDAAYTLEPVASIAIRQGAARLLEAGVIATHLIGRPTAQAFAAGACVTGRFLETRAPVATRLAGAWRAALDMLRADPTTRTLLTQHMNTPADLAPTVPLPNLSMVSALTPQDVADFQKFVDFAVTQGVVRDPIQVSSFIRAL